MIITDGDIELSERYRSLLADAQHRMNACEFTSVHLKQLNDAVDELSAEIGFQFHCPSYAFDTIRSSRQFQRVPRLFRYESTGTSEEEATAIFDKIKMPKIGHCYINGNLDVAYFFSRGAVTPIPYQQYVDKWNEVVSKFPEGKCPLKEIKYSSLFRG